MLLDMQLSEYHCFTKTNCQSNLSKENFDIILPTQNLSKCSINELEVSPSPITSLSEGNSETDQRYPLSHREKFTERKIHSVEEEDIDEVPQGLEMRSTNAENEDRRHRVAESVKAERKDRICGGGQERKDSVCSFVKSREGARRYRGEPIPLSPSRKSKSPIPLRLVPAGNKDGSAYVQAANRRRSQAALCGPGQRK
ncbi:hypothetical protein HZH68_005290 [Vespula germanica]|uniref:Uncharacterized protein n=1 Tax=Vespula germanica TaxID=30212 RepID=A0A834KFP9_VESGE|nr:hypothetical protein HZH68_005290 [Vespula germanica]